MTHNDTIFKGTPISSLTSFIVPAPSFLELLALKEHRCRKRFRKEREHLYGNRPIQIKDFCVYHSLEGHVILPAAAV
jgi:hypothetical protein